MKWSRRNIRIGTSIVVVSGVAAFMFNACSGFQGNSASFNSSAIMECQQPTFQTVPGTITVSIESASSVLPNMQSCLGLSSVSAQTTAENTARLGSFSQTGYVGDVNSAMMMGIAAVAIDACSDLVNQEAAEPSSSRSFFTGVDFTQGSLSQSEIDSAATQLARRCWSPTQLDASGNPTTQELTDIETGTQAMGSIGANYQAINVCASVLGSLSGVMQ